MAKIHQELVVDPLDLKTQRMFQGQGDVCEVQEGLEEFNPTVCEEMMAEGKGIGAVGLKFREKSHIKLLSDPRTYSCSDSRSSKGITKEGQITVAHCP